MTRFSFCTSKRKRNVNGNWPVRIVKQGRTTMTDYLQWVGSMFYPTVNDFIDESARLGVCKRIGRLPGDLEPGESRVFLAHDDGLVGDGFIFGYYVPDQVEYLAHNEDDIPAIVFERVVWISEWYKEEFRGCGTREEGMYLVTLETEKSGVQFLSDFVVFEKPRKLEAFDPGRAHFRGLLEIDYGDEVIDCENRWTTLKQEQAQTIVPPSWIERKLLVVGDDELMQRMKDGPSMSRVAQEIAYETGEKKSSVTYRYLKLTGKVVLKGNKGNRAAKTR